MGRASSKNRDGSNSGKLLQLPAYEQRLSRKKQTLAEKEDEDEDEVERRGEEWREGADDEKFDWECVREGSWPWPSSN